MLTYGGHGEQWQFAQLLIDGKPLAELIGTDALTENNGLTLKYVLQKVELVLLNFVDSSFQSPSYTSVEMIRATMGGEAFRWPSVAMLTVRI